MTSSSKPFKFTEVILALYVAIILATVCLANRFTQIYGFVFPGGMPFFPLTFMLMFAVSEVYGYQYARRYIWIGFFVSLFFSLEVTVVSFLAVPSFFKYKEAYQIVFSPTLRFVISSGIGLIIGEFINIYINARMKLQLRGKLFWLRCLCSLAAGQFILVNGGIKARINGAGLTQY